MAIDFNVINKLSIPKKLLILGSIVVAISVFYYFVFYTKLDKTLGEKNKKLETALKERNEKKAIADNLENFKEQVQKLEIKFKEALQQLPDSKEIDSLLSSINKKGEESGLDFLLFKPLSEVPREFYAEVPVKISVKGSYLDVATFFYKISKLKRIINISEIEMSKPVEVSGKMFLETNCVATTFKFLKSTETEAPKDAKAKK